MSEERMKVLEMLAAGRVTPEQANQLLEALAEPRPAHPSGAGARQERLFSDFTADQLIEMRQHGVNAAFVQEIRHLGFRDVSIDQLIELRDHGVNAQYVGEMRDAGFSTLDLDQLVELRDHGVTPAFIQELRGLGFAELSIDQIVELRDNGVNAAFIQEMRQVQEQQAFRVNVTA